MEIIYCEKCGVRIDPDDVHDNVARKMPSGGVICPKCVKTTPIEIADVAIKKAKSSKSLIPAVPRGKPVDERVAPRRASGRARVVPDRDKSPGIMFALIAGAVLLVAGLYFASGGTKHVQNSPPKNQSSDSTPRGSSNPSSPTLAHNSESPRINNDPPPRSSTSGSMALSVLAAQTSPEEQKAQSEYSKLFDGISEDDTGTRIKKLEDFISRLAPDSDLVPRANVTLQKLRSRATHPNEPEKAPPPVEKAVLIGHWKLNETAGDTAADSSGNNQPGKCINAPQWKDKGMYFDGKDSYVVIANSQALDHVQEGDFSVCAWFKPDDNPAEEADHVHCGYAVIMKNGLHTGISYYRGGYFSMDYWGEKGERLNAVAHPLPPGVFYHVCGIVNRKAGETRIYINGTPEQPKFWNPATVIKNYGAETWKIGVAIPNQAEWGWPAKGLVKDVRIYKGALTDAEVAALARDQR
jgi:hypothetical protein